MRGNFFGSLQPYSHLAHGWRSAPVIIFIPESLGRADRDAAPDLGEWEAADSWAPFQLQTSVLGFRLTARRSTVACWVFHSR